MVKEAFVTIQGLKLGNMTTKGGRCVEIQFKEKGEVMGTLKVSRTRLEWTPPNAKKRLFHLALGIKNFYI